MSARPYPAAAYLVAGELLLALLGAGLAYLVLGQWFPFAWHLDGRAVGLGVLLAVPPMLLVEAVRRDRGRRLPGVWRSFESIAERLAPALGPLLARMGGGGIVLLSLAAGVGEEVLFRGVLQPMIGLLAASVIFGALHALSLGYFVLATVFGVYLGLAYQASDNLVVPIVAHAAYDVFALYVLRGIYVGRGPRGAWHRGGPQ